MELHDWSDTELLLHIDAHLPPRTLLPGDRPERIPGTPAFMLMDDLALAAVPEGADLLRLFDDGSAVQVRYERGREVGRLRLAPVDRPGAREPLLRHLPVGEVGAGEGELREALYVAEEGQAVRFRVLPCGCEEVCTFRDGELIARDVLPVPGDLTWPEDPHGSHG